MFDDFLVFSSRAYLKWLLEYHKETIKSIEKELEDRGPITVAEIYEIDGA